MPDAVPTPRSARDLYPPPSSMPERQLQSCIASVVPSQRARETGKTPPAVGVVGLFARTGEATEASAPMLLIEHKIVLHVRKGRLFDANCHGATFACRSVHLLYRLA